MHGETHLGLRNRLCRFTTVCPAKVCLAQGSGLRAQGSGLRAQVSGLPGSGPPDSGLPGSRAGVGARHEPELGVGIGGIAVSKALRVFALLTFA